MTALTRVTRYALLVLALIGASAATTPTPGMRVVVTNSGLAELKDVALPIINAALQDLTLPDIDLDEHVPVVGHITLDLTNIKITGFDLPSAALTVSSPPHFTMDMSGLTMAISMDYQWRRVHWPHISDHGTVTAEPKGGSITVGMGVTAAAGHVVLTDSTASVAFSGFTVHFDGKVAWLYNLIVGLFKNTIKDAVQSAVQKELMNVVGTSLNRALAKLRIHQTLGGGKSRLDVDVGVVDITAGGTYLSLGDLMAVANNATGAACPVQPHTLPSVTPGAAGSMLQLLIDDAFLNCVSWVAATNGAMSATITNANLPPQFPLRLNTSDWAQLIPALAAKYPDRPMQLLLSPVAAPFVKSATTGMQGSMDFALGFSVVTNAGAVVPVFTFNTSLALGVDVHAKMVNNTPALILDITKLTLTMGVTKSEIGTINLAPIQSLFNTFLPLVQDLLNAVLAKGFPLPSIDGLSLVGPQIDFSTGFMAIATNFTFSAGAALQVTSDT